jgi:hypothetical protein
MALGDLRVNGSEFVTQHLPQKRRRCCACIIVQLIVAMSLVLLWEFSAHAYTLFEEHFESVDFSGRDWYDVASSPTLTTVAYDGSYALQCLFNSSGTNCTMGDLGRHKFSATDEIYISVWVRPSANWQGSGQTYHPHLFLFMTDRDTDYWGPSVSRLTTYVELNNVTARMNAQDSTNIDQANAGVNLCAVTESRAANGCNGNCDGIATDCYGSYPNWRNEKVFAGSGASFNLNAWNHIEAYIKLNTISGGTATSDGIMQYWLNGTQVINQTAVMLRTGASSTMQFDKVILAPWIGDGSPVSQYILIDNLVIGTERPSRTEYYVEPSGTASWPTCTSIDTACSATTAMANVEAGETVYFRGGDYYPPSVGDPSYPSWYPSNSGTSGHEIILISYPTETAVIYQPLSAGNAAIGCGQGGYVIWDRFHLVKRTWTEAGGLFLTELCDHVTLRNSVIDGVHVSSDSLNSCGLYMSNSTYLYAYNNIFQNWTGPSPGVNAGAMWLMNDDHAYIYQNTFNNCSNGVQTKGSMSHIYAYRNFFTGVDKPFHWQQQTASVTNFDAYQNVAIMPSSGSEIYFMYSADPAYVYTTVNTYNNTVYCPAGCTGFLWGNANAHSNSIWNNIVYGASGTTRFWYTVSAELPNIDYLDYNNYYTAGTANWHLDSTTYTSIANWRTATSFDSAATTTNPGLVNPGGTTPEDYKRSSYPSDGRGGAYASVMGAYITGSELIGYQAVASEETTTDTTPPVISNGSPSGILSYGTTSTSMSISTNETATCKYNLTDVAYASMSYTFSTTNGTSHSQTLAGLTNGSNYLYYVRCIDAAGNPNTSSTAISWAVSADASAVPKARFVGVRATGIH